MGLVPIGIDGTGQFLGFWVSTQISRVLTGLPAGIIAGIVIGIIIMEISEFPLLKKTKNN